MPSFKSMEISKELSNDNRLSIKYSLFGILSKVTYQPTHSKIVSKKIEYTQEDGGKLERAINANADNRIRQFSNMGKLREAHLGNYLLEICHSEDREFAAMRLFKFAQLVYQPVTDVCIIEGSDAKIVISSL